jgi:eukaryotic-like serine/threonine-protein kinase
MVCRLEHGKMPPMSVPSPGLEIVPGLTLLRLLGRGGLGEAWLARDDARSDEVVAKVLPADASPERVALLRREARLGRRLAHPRIVPALEFRSGERGSAVTLRYMRGGDASRTRGATPLEVVRLGRDVAEALEHLHGLGVVHRDVKASNVLLDEEGRAHLADLGIAAVLSSGASGAGGPAQPADDLYALGALLYELLSGRTPFPPEATEDERLTLEPPPVASPFPVPDALRALVAALLARSPGARPASAAVVKDALGAIESRLERAPGSPVDPLTRLPSPPRVVERAAASPPGLERRLDRMRTRPRAGLSAGQRTLLAGLLVAALVAVVWLLR